MTRLIMFFIITWIVLVGCSTEEKNGNNEKMSEVLRGSNLDPVINKVITPNTEHNGLQDSPAYLAKNEGELSLQDSDTAYEMCVKALTDYYKAVWNGEDIELNTFIDNESLEQYMQKKIQSQYDLHSAYSNDKVQNIEISSWEVEYTDDADGGFLYLKLPAEIKYTVGSFGEATEFLVRNINGKLVIVDWYDGGKDSYDFLVRGENQTIDNPNVWNDGEWVKELDRKQNEFSGSTR